MSDPLSLLVRHVTWPLYIERDAPGTRREWRALEDSQRWSSGRIHELQRSRLRELLAHAYRHVPFYRHRFKAAGMDPAAVDPALALEALPPLEKRDIQDHRAALRADNIPASQLVENRTGGSTGEPLVFDLDRARSGSRYAAALRANRWAGWEPGDRVAALWGSSRDAHAPRGWKEVLRASLCDRMTTLNAARITPEDLKAFVRTLSRERPKALLGYSRMLLLLARAWRESGAPPPGLRAIISSAEVLEPADRREIASALGAPVFDRYGAREVSTIASECDRHDGLHVSAENLWVEVVTPEGAALADGRTGELWVTDLRNFGMPLIRYRIGDLAARISGTCACGRGLPRLGPVTGRITDLLLLPDGTRVSGAALTIVMVAELKDVRQVQLYQPRRAEVQVRVVPGPGFGAATEAEIVRRAKEKLGAGVDVRVVEVADIAPEPSGKHRFSISEAT